MADREHMPRAVHDATAAIGRTETLALYHAERARGIVHTADWDAYMARLQAAYDQQTDRQAQRAADEVTQDRRRAAGLTEPWPPAALSAVNEA